MALLPGFSCGPAAVTEPEGAPADQNGDVEVEPMRNGAGHISETESSDSGANPGDKDHSTGASQDLEGWRYTLPAMRLSLTALFVTRICFPAPQILLGGADLGEANGKRQYDRDFLLGFQFMPACIQKPEGLPPITDVVLDKVSSLFVT